MSIKGDHKDNPQSTGNMARLFLHDLLPFHPIIPTIQHSWGHLKRGHTIFFTLFLFIHTRHSLILIYFFTIHLTFEWIIISIYSQSFLGGMYEVNCYTSTRKHALMSDKREHFFHKLQTILCDFMVIRYSFFICI